VVFIAAGRKPSGESAASSHRTARAVPLQKMLYRVPRWGLGCIVVLFPGALPQAVMWLHLLGRNRRFRLVKSLLDLPGIPPNEVRMDVGPP
jgi:hypothetical protein